MSSFVYTLIDQETQNVVGAYRSQQPALRDVADAVQVYGQDSEEVTSLALIRHDVPTQEGLVARGSELAMLAHRNRSEIGC